MPVFAKASSDCLTFHLSNIPPSQEFKVYIETSFVGYLSAENSIRFSLPSCMSENFQSTPILYDFEIEGGSKVLSVNFSNTNHEIEGSKFHFKGRYDKAMQKITITYEEKISNVAIKSKIDNETYIGVSVLPDIPNSVLKPIEYYLVLDCSGSMKGEPIRIATNALTLFIRSLPVGCFFNVIRFGSAFQAMYPQVVEYNEANFKDALSKVSVMQADLKSTDAYSPLNCIFNTPVKSGFTRQIIFITDGKVKYEELTLSLVEKNRNTSVYSIGIGSSLSERFLKDVAMYSGGKSYFIERLEKVMSTVVDAISQTCKATAMSDIQVHLEETESITISPFPLPPMFNNRLSHFYIKSDSEVSEGKCILISGKNGGDTHDIVASIVSSENIKFDKLFGYFCIKDMETNLMSVGNDPSSKQKIINQSIKYGIQSQFTAWWGQNKKQQINVSQYRKLAALNGQITVTQQQRWGSANESQPIRTYRSRVSSGVERECGVCSSSCCEAGYIHYKYEYSMLNVIQMQSFEGFWIDYDFLQKMSRKNVNIESDDQRIKATILAIALLEKFDSKQAEAWKLIKEKALAWLYSQNSSQKWETIISEVAKQI